MQNGVERSFDADELRHVVADEPEPRLSGEASDVAKVARYEVVHRDDLVPLGEEPVAEVAPQKPGASGDQNPHHARPREAEGGRRKAMFRARVRLPPAACRLPSSVMAFPLRCRST